MKSKLNFNKIPQYKSKSLYRFNRYINTFERGNYKLFIKSYYKLKPSQVKYWRQDPI